MRKYTVILFLMIFVSCAGINRQMRYNEYAFKLVEGGLYGEALFYLEKADSMGPEDRIKNNMALCFEALGDTEKAREYYQEALRLRETRAVRKNYEAFEHADH